jgi:hypothetical protein
MAILLVMMLAEEDRTRAGDHFYLGPRRMAPVTQLLQVFICGEIVSFRRGAPALATAEDSHR